MFSGIITHRGKIKRILSLKGALDVFIEAQQLLRTRDGESISVNGVCSTVVRASQNSLQFHYMPETLRKTNLGKFKAGDMLNLEPSLTLSSLLGGHLVLGHVDGLGRIRKIAKDGSARIIRIAIQKTLLPYIVPKGSVAVEGVSLTVVKKFKNGFTVSLIPYTLAHTNLGEKRVGDTVNIECDIIAKYLKGLLTTKRHANK
ncbi:MAG: riboflavin synthase [Patescibacteria group bacterium]